MKQKTKKRIRPKSRSTRTRRKQKIVSSIRAMRRKSGHQQAQSRISAEVEETFPAAELLPNQKNTFDRNDLRFRGVHPEEITLRNFRWQGLLTLRFESDAFSKDNARAHSNRIQFLKEFMENVRGKKLRLKASEFDWVACEEFGTFGTGHLHILFSFDYLKAKGRLDKLQVVDFSENGHFYREAREAANFVSQKLSLNPKSVLLDWTPGWDNVGLTGYFCKRECGRDEKFFHLDSILKRAVFLNAA